MKIVKRGEIYLAKMPDGIGSEQTGERPVLVIQNDKGNKYSPTVTVLPITSRVHKSYGMPTHVFIKDIPGLDKKSAIMAEQIMTIDKRRLLKKISYLPGNILHFQVVRAIKIQLGLPGRK